MRSKNFMFDASELTPEVLDRFPVWMNGHWFDEDDVERRYGPFSQSVTESALIAYEGPLPYPLLAGNDEYPSHVIVKCIATTAVGGEFPGYLTPLVRDDRLPRLSPHIFASGGTELCLGELNAAEQAMILPRWRSQVEGAFGLPLHSLFPITLSVPTGILPTAVPVRWSLPSLMYLTGRRPQVVPSV